MRKKVCFVVGAGENYGLDFIPNENDLTIAADAGLQYLEQKEIGADLVIGDFDTLHFKPQYKNVIELNPEKDITDMQAAIYEGIRAGYDLFHIYCGMGGRIDHTIANIQLLSELSQKKHARIPYRTRQHHHSYYESLVFFSCRPFRLYFRILSFRTIQRCVFERIEI